MSCVSKIAFLALLLSATASHGEAKRKIFMDNDGYTPLIVALPLKADIEVMALSASFGDPKLPDSVGQAVDVVKNFSLTQCIPVHAGAEQPLLRRKNTYYAWQELYGDWVWQGGWDPQYNLTYNLSDLHYEKETPAAVALIDIVRQHPGEVDIYGAGLMTTIAQAVSLWPDIVKHVKSLWIMGGYIDGQYSQVTGGSLLDDINTDFNLGMDPEAAQIVFTAGFKELYIGGNVTNYVFPTQKLFDRFIDKYGLDNINNNTKYSAIASFIGNGNASSVFLPLWDETVSGLISYPELVKKTVNVTVGVDTSYSSPFYGNLRLWPSNAPPKKAPFGKAKLITEIDIDQLFDRIYDALTTDFSKYCMHLNTTEL